MFDPLYEQLKKSSVRDVRASIRSGTYIGQTAGLAAGRLQANLAILEKDHADDFYEFCQLNKRPCPLVGLSIVGDPHMPELGGEIDLRTDVPGYNVYRYAELIEQRSDISDLWQSNFVGFALGCSFTFERALREAGITLRHISENKTVPMFRTSIALKDAGPFGGGMVVSMRPIQVEKVDLVFSICGGFPHAHGEPVHVGEPSKIGIADIGAPDWGDAMEIEPGEVPVFWACGVTPQNALARARPPICITHTPGRMLIADVAETDRPDLVVAENYRSSALS